MFHMELSCTNTNELCMCGGEHAGPWLAGLQKLNKNSDSSKTVTQTISVDSAEDATGMAFATVSHHHQMATGFLLSEI